MPFRRLLVIFSVLLSPLCATAASFSFAPFTGIRNSRTEEALFFSGTFGTDSSEKCSLLEWNEKYVFVYGLDSEIVLENGKNSFEFSSRLQSSLPFNQGLMTDTDWNSSLEKKHQTEFDLDENMSFTFKTQFAWSRKLDKGFSIQPSLSASYDYLKFKGVNGRGWYYLDTDNPHYYPDEYLHPAGINYRSYKAALMTGLSVRKDFESGLTLTAGAEVSPFTFVLARDRHLGSKDYFTTDDYIYSYFKNYSVYADVHYRFNNRLSIFAQLRGSYFFFTKGEEYYNWDNGSKNTVSSQKAGYSYKDFEIILGVRRTF